MGERQLTPKHRKRSWMGLSLTSLPSSCARRSTLVRMGKWQTAPTLSELGVYGVFLRTGDKVLLNKEVRVCVGE